ncbi:hypothetical protein [Vitiosangium sp. GDMCC 1.1324]|uniref:hypothetical protein n=1 Tax=Vitiosangium sp. (strain GDMCC 1.1324) TaxID=2138576 RepID=UPI0011B6C658|nr:hypothetical protein [Vitiosangium sp. GDMCC 1.1324]
MSFALLLIVLSLGCFHHRGWFEHQEPSVQILSYDSIMVGGYIDGPTLRALKVVADDFFPAGGPPRACIDTPEAYKYYSVRRGEIIYVAILQNPGYCGRAYSSLDAGARYAISIDGRILRRLLAGEPDVDTLEDGGLRESGSEQSFLDGGASAIDVTVPPDARVSFPVSTDAGSPLPDAGSPLPDAGMP